MEIQHIILLHDDEIECKKCKNKVLITPVDTEGYWQCGKCHERQKICTVREITITHCDRR
jgi:ribosomal protein L37AE/L43A